MLRSLLVAFCVLLSLSQSAWSEDFKGKSSAVEWTMGAMTGLGVLDSAGGFALVGNVARKIVHRGFIPDINDQVFVELQMGPLWMKGATALFYSTHLRWDFRKDAEWTFYALGGLGGHFSPRALGDHATLLPRLGVGAFWRVAPLVNLRGEFSHELLAVGVSYAL